MILSRVGCAVGAMLFGVRAIGYWLVLRLGGALPAVEWRNCVGVVCYSAVLFVILSSAAAYLRERTGGTRALVAKALYFAGVYGLPPIALFAALSKGAFLQMPERLGLIILFGCFVLVFRSPIPKQTIAV